MDHTKPTTTLDVYGHLFEGAEHRNAEALDAGWREAGQSNVVTLRPGHTG